MPAIDDDDHAAKYELADELFAAAGLGWYEVSNWSRTPQDACRHNLAYWRGDDWWGIGPGAHSHVGGVRWWNVKHPTAYASRLAQGRVARRPDAKPWTPPPGAGARSCLQTRLVRGHPGGRPWSRTGRREVAGLIARRSWWIRRAAFQGRLVLTLKGRLLADAVVRRLLPD